MSSMPRARSASSDRRHREEQVLAHRIIGSDVRACTSRNLSGTGHRCASRVSSVTTGSRTSACVRRDDLYEHMNKAQALLVCFLIAASHARGPRAHSGRTMPQCQRHAARRKSAARHLRLPMRSCVIRIHGAHSAEGAVARAIPGARIQLALLLRGLRPPPERKEVGVGHFPF